MGHAFEFSPFGIVPMGGGAQSAMAEMHGAQIIETPVQSGATIQNVGTHTQVPTNRIVALGVQLSPRQLVKQAKARVRELNTEIKRLKTLIKERDELQRLIVASKTKAPRATHAKVSSITRANAHLA